MARLNWGSRAPERRRLTIRSTHVAAGEEIGTIVNRPTANETSAITTGPSRAGAARRLADLDPDTSVWGGSSMAAT